jgi:predicted N-formylglutamate amidohydrolase
MSIAARDVVTVINRQGGSRCLLVCDHASNRMPPEYGTLGLPSEELGNHTAWDPGAMAVAGRMAEILDAPLVASGVSRLVIDCNRALDAPNLIPETAEGRPVPDNAKLADAERERRIATFHAPFHDAIDAVIAERASRAPVAAIVSVHSFTPVYFGVARPWTLGILHDDDARIADAMLARLEGESGLVLGRNQPYSPADGVYYTLARHGTSRGRAAAMIEIRNDQIRDPAGIERWAGMLAGALGAAMGTIEPGLAAARVMVRTEGGSIA